MFCIITPLFILFSWIYYFYITNGITQNAQRAVLQSQINVMDIIVTTEKSYEFVADSYDEIIRSSLLTFNEQYEMHGQDANKIDLQALKKRYGNKLDFYMVNKKGVITRTTFPLALGIDFSKFPEFFQSLDKIRRGDAIEISKVTSDLKTRELRKWGYLPTKDHQWLLEVGIDSTELRKYIKKIDYVAIEKRIKKYNPYIKSLRVVDVHDIVIGFPKEVISKEVKKIIDKVQSTETNYRVYLGNGLIDKDYIFINTFKSKFNDFKKVIKIEYNNALLMRELSQLKLTIALLFIGYSIISLLVMFFSTSHFITNPLIKLTNSLKNIRSDNVLINVPFSGDNEIGVLTKTFNATSQKLVNSIISKKYFENILDSMGDIVIITDVDFNIQQINRYAYTILGIKPNSLSQQPLSLLLVDKLPLQKLQDPLKDKGSVIGVDLVFKSSISMNLDILATFSTIYDEKGLVSGYICNAKNVTQEKMKIKELYETNQKLQAEEEHSRIKSQRDFLTGMYNRRHMQKILSNLVQQSRVTKSDFCVLMLDIDYFKKINDTFGHPAGDQVLIKISEIIQTTLRTNDSSCRYGGEEFLIVFPNTAAQFCLEISERLRCLVESTRFLDEQVKITISGGLTVWNNKSIEAIIESADQQLYKAKKAGRNRICVDAV